MQKWDRIVSALSLLRLSWSEKSFLTKYPWKWYLWSVKRSVTVIYLNYTRSTCSSSYFCSVPIYLTHHIWEQSHGLKQRWSKEAVFSMILKVITLPIKSRLFICLPGPPWADPNLLHIMVPFYTFLFFCITAKQNKVVIIYCLTFQIGHWKETNRASCELRPKVQTQCASSFDSGIRRTEAHILLPILLWGMTSLGPAALLTTGPGRAPVPRPEEGLLASYSLNNYSSEPTIPSCRIQGPSPITKLPPTDAAAYSVSQEEPSCPALLTVTRCNSSTTTILASLVFGVLCLACHNTLVSERRPFFNY